MGDSPLGDEKCQAPPFTHFIKLNRLQESEDDLFTIQAMTNPVIRMVIIAKRLGRKVTTFPKNLLKDSTIATRQTLPSNSPPHGFLPQCSIR